MFRQLSKHFPDRSTGDSPEAGQKARQKLNRALLFGALLLGISIASPFLLSSPQPPAATGESSYDASNAREAADRTPAPADPSPIDLSSPGVIVAVLLLAGGVGLALYLRNGGSGESTPNTLIVPVAEYKISPQQKLQLVRCTDELLLLAVSSEHINLLKTYPADALPLNGDPTALTNGSLPAATDGLNDSAFARVLQKYASQFTTPGTT